MKKTLITLLFVSSALVPSLASASTLTPTQVISVLNLLIAFNVDATTIGNVVMSLLGSAPSNVPIETAVPSPVAVTPEPASLPGSSAITTSASSPITPVPSSQPLSITLVDLGPLPIYATGQANQIIANLKVKNVSTKGVIIGYPNLTVSRFDPPKSAGTQQMLADQLGVSITNETAGMVKNLAFLYENGRQPKYKGTSGSLLYEAITLVPGEVMDVQVRLTDQPLVVGAFTLNIGSASQGIQVVPAP